jgi:hypothetical protein
MKRFKITFLVITILFFGCFLMAQGEYDYAVITHSISKFSSPPTVKQER